jgi:hypothetical protein
VVHDPVEVLGLAGMGVAHGDPAVRSEPGGVLRAAGVAELAAGAHQDPGQRVDDVIVSGHD